MKTVLISGAGGFIASSLARSLKDHQFTTIGITRSLRDINGFDRLYEACLGESIEYILEKEEIDVFIHCALDASKNATELNLTGTTHWFEEAEKHDVSLQIFLSSIAAAPATKSNYGQIKYSLEKLFLSLEIIMNRKMPPPTRSMATSNRGMFIMYPPIIIPTSPVAVNP